ncbi:hypothetical protein AB0J94_21910 [Micromonospora noduli]|uniref:hypothetical protein n=1 Tax=Micromonospora noduli TaxID=709876 RepID=UPI00341DDB54
MADRRLTGASGEHYVCYALARQGWVATLTREGLERTDILAVSTLSRRMVELQVKAAAPAGKVSWMPGAKAFTPAFDHEWYVFIALTRDLTHAPTCYIVPRFHVAAATWIVHRNWLTHPDAQPGTRNTTLAQARITAEVWSGYEGRWDLLEHSTNSVPVLLPHWVRERAGEPRVGLPPGHSWASALPPDWEGP